MRTFLVATLCVALYSATIVHALDQRASNWTVGQTVQTNSGAVTGHAASGATGVSEYLGIPFAIPPVGALRWTAPQKYAGISTINGSSYVSFDSSL